MPRVSRVLRPAAIAAGVGAIATFIWIVRSSTATSRFESSENTASGKVDPASWSNRAITIANLGHATLLMHFAGVCVISDPTLFNRVGLTIGPLVTIGPRRMVPPPLQPDQLQGLDLILITHAHMDHLDIPSLG